MSQKIIRKLIYTLLVIGNIGFIGWLFHNPTARVGYAPKQPIEYSHELHANQLNIDCQYCHTGVTKGKKAGVPSLNICMNCHASVGLGKPEIKKLISHYQENKYVEWIRVHNLPDHVRFSHSAHMNFLLKEGKATKTACVACHGNVYEMKVVKQKETLNMNFCVDCHRENKHLGGKIDCSTCHY